MAVKITQTSSQTRVIFEKMISQLDKKVAKVGWFKTKYPDGTNVPEVAYIQNFGSVKNGIPPRPFVKPAIDANIQKYQALARSQGKKIISGESTITIAMDLIGQKAAGDLKKEIAQGSFEPLKPSTVEARLRKRSFTKIKGSEEAIFNQKKFNKLSKKYKEGGSPGIAKPLVFTGLLLATITNHTEDK